MFAGLVGTHVEAILNAVEPSLQLDQEGVSDPVRLRTGLAYRQPLPRQMALVGALDVEKTDGSVTDLHAGLVSAYGLANEHRIAGGLNRVFLVSDGGANAGVTDIKLFFKTYAYIGY